MPVYELSEKQRLKVSKGANNRNRYNQVPHLAQDTNGKVTNSQLDTTNESQEVSPFPAGDHKAHINRRTQRHNKHKTKKKHKRSTALERSVVSKLFYWRAKFSFMAPTSLLILMWTRTYLGMCQNTTNTTASRSALFQHVTKRLQGRKNDRA